MSIRIITDSTADLAPRYKDRITVVPMTIHFGDKEYIDGVTIDKNQFYEMLETTDVVPTTSQATPAAFEDIFRETEKAGDQAVVITISSKLSGTCQSANIAAADYPGVRVIDSLNGSVGTGILVEYAVQCLDKGMGFEELAARLEEVKKNICLIAVVDTLEYLKKGGRISKATALAGGIMNIKPVLAIKDGEVALIGKARGLKNGNNVLTKKVNESGIDYDMPVLLGYAGTSDSLLQKYVEDSRELWEGKIDPLDIVQVCSVIGTHTGPGTIIVTFFKKR